MRFVRPIAPFSLVTLLFFLLSNSVAERLIESKSLNACQDNSSFTASLFNVIFTPKNKTITFDIVGVSSIQGNVSFAIEVKAYGYSVVKRVLDPCEMGLPGMCPMSTGQIDILSNIQLEDNTINQIPGIAYGVPDLDANVKVIINATANPDVSLACVEANLSNGQTVDQKGVGWVTAVIAGLALMASAVTSGLGYSNTAAHVASNALSLFGYFQAQAIIGLTAVPLPPIVQSWTQNFQWTMGIIHIKFMQSIATWYQKSTGGTPASLLNSLTTTSVQVEKRSLSAIGKRSTEHTLKLAARAFELSKRADGSVSGSYVVRGIKRVAFRAGIESTNLFLTGLSFFCIFIILTIFCVVLFKAYCEVAIKMRWMKSDKFQDFRNGWFVVLKGIMFRMVLIGYPQMMILCLWEFTQVDSPAEVILAIFFFFGMTGTLAWAAMKVIRIAKRSVEMHKNPAYILYSDPAALNKWGFLYVQFRATAYYFILPTLTYIFIKSVFVAFGQNSGTVQAIALLLIEAFILIGASVIRPWMDKSTNSFNVAIAVVNFLNTIFLLVFTDMFSQPGIVTGVMGVIFFIYNAVFSLVLLILVLIATVYAIIRQNPDSRYQPMSDDRASFIKSQTQLTTELDALGVTARGDKAAYKHNLDLDDDNESWSTESVRNPVYQNLPASDTNPRAPSRNNYDQQSPAYQSRGPSPAFQDNRTKQATSPNYSEINRPNWAESPGLQDRTRVYNNSGSNLPYPDNYPGNLIPDYSLERDSSPTPASNRTKINARYDSKFD
ncbi:putative flavin carrier protein 2 [Erysiphe pulchra]|uniref:Putative flavin carrier protein 2 n=1 Tax=Erysiphe pulchra TaxID=225359 RepID=A0A2S4PUI5_9PEZI|nr:putative flavin carrier protein 2 [Erysiphe pulchra]